MKKVYLAGETGGPFAAKTVVHEKEIQARTTKRLLSYHYHPKADVVVGLWMGEGNGNKGLPRRGG